MILDVRTCFFWQRTVDLHGKISPAHGNISHTDICTYRFYICIYVLLIEYLVLHVIWRRWTENEREKRERDIISYYRYIYIYIPGPSDLLLSGGTTQDFNKSGLIVVPPVGFVYLRQDCSTFHVFPAFLYSANFVTGDKHCRTVQHLSSTKYTSNPSLNRFQVFQLTVPQCRHRETK